MGKIHRIKKQLRALMAQLPPPVTGHYHWLAEATAVSVGKRYDGTFYISHYSRAYRGLINPMIDAYNKAQG